MSGYQDGERWIDSDGTSHTVNSTSDPNVPGGYYYNQHGPTTPMARSQTSLRTVTGRMCPVRIRASLI